MLNAFKKTRKQKHVNNTEYSDKLNFRSIKEKFITLIFMLLSRTKAAISIIVKIKNFLAAEILYLSSKKPNINTIVVVIKNISV